MELLITWAAEQEVELSKVRGDWKCRHLCAAEDIVSGDTFLKIPQHLLLHAGHCKEDAALGQAFSKLRTAAGAEMDDRHLLCLLLIVERAKGAKSRWHQYINYLPQSYDDPLWWTHEEVKLLAGTRLEIAVKEHDMILSRLTCWRNCLVEVHRADACTTESQLFEETADDWPLSDKAVLWAKSTVWSRAFNIPYLGGMGKPGLALLPVGDLLDHDPQHHVAWHTGSSGTDPFSFITHTPVRKGDVLYSNYGNKSNEELILGYGFAVPNNQADFFHVMIGLGDKEPSGSDSSNAVPDERVIQRQALLHHLGLSTSHYLKLGAGQQHTAPGSCPSPGVAVQALLNTAAICLLPDHLAYHWWSAPSAVSHNRLLQSQAADTSHSVQTIQAVDTEAVPGQVEVKGIPTAIQHNPAGTNSVKSLDPPELLASETQSSTEDRTAFRGSPGASAGSKEQMRNDSNSNGSEGGPFACSPVHVQLQVLRSLRHLLASKLKAVAGGSAEEDQELAQQAGCSHAACMALQYRAKQKQIANAALAALACKAAEVVQTAVARLGQAVAQPSKSQQSWQQHNGVQYHKVREAHAHNTTANAPHQQQPAELPHGQVPHSWAATPHWGLVTTARVSPGDILLTVPHHSLVVSQSPEQTMIQMAALAYDQATDWYSRTSLDHMGGVESFQQAEAEAQVVQARQKGQQQVDASQGSLLAEAKSFGVEQGQERQAEGVSQELVLAGLVEDWLQPGKIVLGLPGSLLMAQLWPEHESSGLGCQCIQALAGLPVEQEVMAEAEEALQKLQRLLPQLQAAMGQQGASWQGPQLFQAHAALLWAVTCMERCTRADPSGQGLLLAPAMAALPQDLLGVVAEMSWNDSDNCLNLTATCPLPANLPLTTALIAVGADPDHLLMTHGLPALSWAQKAQQPQSAAQVALPGQGNLQMPWQAPDAASFQLCIEPPEEDECRDAKLQLLAASALGTSHALTESSSQERLLAALALCSCDSEGLSQLGAASLLQAIGASSNAARKHRESAASVIQQNMLDSAEQELQDQQTAFVAKLLSDKSLHEVAQATLTSLLDAEMSGICDTAEAAVTSNLQEKDCETSPMHIIADFRKDIVRVLGLHLNREQPETRRTKKKKAHRKKSKRKRTLQS